MLQNCTYLNDDVIKNFKMLQLDWKSVQVLIKYGDEGFQ